MEQSMRTEAGKLWMNLSGAIHVRDAGRLRTTLLAQLEDGCKTIVIDMAKVDLIDSSGLGVLIQVHQRLDAVGGSLALIGVSGVVREVLELSRLDRVFQIDYLK